MPSKDVYHSIDDLPAVKNERIKEWYNMGVLHRDNDLPAVIYKNGPQKWILDGKLHRDNDLPAISYDYDDQYYNNFLDNDLPTIIYGRYYCWYNKGKLHRDNRLPAIVATDLHNQMQARFALFRN